MRAITGFPPAAGRSCNFKRGNIASSLAFPGQAVIMILFIAAFSYREKCSERMNICTGRDREPLNKCALTKRNPRRGRRLAVNLRQRLAWTVAIETKPPVPCTPAIWDSRLGGDGQISSAVLGHSGAAATAWLYLFLSRKQTKSSASTEICAEQAAHGGKRL